MEVQVRERLVGAFVLVAIVVLFVPALLKGPERQAEAEVVSGEQTREFVVPPASEPVDQEVLIPEAARPDATAPVVDEPLPQVVAPPIAASEPETVPAPAPEQRRPDVEAPSAGIAPGQAAWAVQLGAFSTRDKAESLVAQLRKRGYAAFVLEYRANGKVLHRVRVGPEQDRQRALSIAGRLRSEGFQPVVAPHP